jgi:hypothetical protein
VDDARLVATRAGVELQGDEQLEPEGRWVIRGGGGTRVAVPALEVPRQCSSVSAPVLVGLARAPRQLRHLLVDLAGYRRLVARAARRALNKGLEHRAELSGSIRDRLLRSGLEINARLGAPRGQQPELAVVGLLVAGQQ